MNSINIFFDIFVINLLRRKDRLEEFKERCPLSGYNIFEAIDGKDIIDKKINLTTEEEKINCENFYENGCFISHYRIWKLFQEKSCKDYCLIYEDD
ncbi:MAG: glycosyltransferase family 25 protein, partial [Acidimicrobiales bacterium]